MSSQFSTQLPAGPATLPPPGPPGPDPFAPFGKLGDILRQGGPLETSIQRQMASKMLLDNLDAMPEGATPYDWDEADKTKSLSAKDLGLKWLEGEGGVSDKPKDPRLKKDKQAVDGEPEDGKPKDPADPFGDKPYKSSQYYEKNKGHLDFGGFTDYVNQQAYKTKLRDEAAEKEKAAGKSGTRPDASHGSDGKDTPAKPFYADRFDHVDGKRTGISADTQFGNFTPELRDGPWSKEEIRRNSAHLGYEKFNSFNNGAGFTQANAGAWGLTEEAKRGGTVGGGLGLRGEAINVIPTSSNGGQLTLRGTGLLGAEANAGGKAKFKPYDTNLSGGFETRVGMFGEAGVAYRPVGWQPTILGAPVNLSPEVAATGRVFQGGELGAGAKMGWRFVPDPVSGKMTPEIGMEAKGAAFAGGKAEAEGSVGLADVGSIGASGAVMYGVGVEGKAGLGLRRDDQGRLRLKGEFKVGAALGLGFGWGFKFDVNIDGLARFGQNLAKANREFFQKIGIGVNKGVTAVQQAFGKVGDFAKKTVDNVKQGVENVANKVADGVKDVTNKVVDGVKDVANKVGDGVKSAAKKVGNFFKKLF